MNTTKISIIFLLLALMVSSASAQQLPAKKEVMDKMVLTNAYFMNKWPDTGKSIITNRERPSNIWTRAVYYEGLMALYGLNPDKVYYDYGVSWGEAHKWGLRDGIKNRNADNQCCGQTYIDLYGIDKKPERIKDIQASIDLMLATDKINDWDWIDALWKGWKAMATESVHPNGFLGYTQGTGKQPSDGQPVTYTSIPDFEDYGLGCFLLAGSEVWKMAK